jgi:hypothetical protein
MVNFFAACNENQKPVGATITPRDATNDYEPGDNAEPIRWETVPADPFDMGPVKARLSDYDSAVDSMVEQAEFHEIEDDASNTRAVEMAGQAKSLAKNIEKVRKEIVDPAFRFKKSVDNLAKAYRDRLDRIERGLKQKISAYHRAQEVKRREAERKAAEAARKMQERVDAEAAAAGVETVKIVAPIAQEPPKVTRTAEGSAHQQKKWTWDRNGVDFEKVPDEFKTLDVVGINKAVREGVRNIPGIRIYQETTTVIRS